MDGHDSCFLLRIVSRTDVLYKVRLTSLILVRLIYCTLKDRRLAHGGSWRLFKIDGVDARVTPVLI